jgi:threonine dehydrogenase-like Zn-dependent dehydrogenase
MKAIAVKPHQPESLHLRELPQPRLEDVPDGEGVLVKVLRVGLCGTDREIYSGLYGQPPAGEDFLVLGHENFGVVEATGPHVRGFASGDYVVSIVRRPGNSLYDLVGAYDLTTDDVYYERGINLLHGFLTEYYAEKPDFLIKVPRGIQHVGVLLEPASVIEKGIMHAYDIQRRLPIWRPIRAAVLGAGPIGLLASMAFRLRALEVVTAALPRPPYLNSQLLDAIGARYVSTQQMRFREISATYGPFDIIFEATGYGPLVFEAMEVLGKNGVLIVSGLSGGGRHVTVPADAINVGFVLYNKAMVGTVNAAHQHFEAAIRDLATCETQFPGWLTRLLTHRINGLRDYPRMAELFKESETSDHRPIKAWVEVGR